MSALMWFLQYNKAWVALALGIVVTVDRTVGLSWLPFNHDWIGIAIALFTPVAVWAVPNIIKGR